MGGQHDPLVDFAGEFRNEIVGVRLVGFLLDLDTGTLTVFRHDLHGVLHIDIDTQNDLSLAGGGAQRLLVDIPIGAAVPTGEGDEAQSPVFQHVLIVPHVQGLVREHDMILTLGKGKIVRIPEIIERSFHRSAAAADISLAGIRLPIHGQRGRMDVRSLDGEALHAGGKADRFAPLL